MMEEKWEASSCETTETRAKDFCGFVFEWHHLKTSSCFKTTLSGWGFSCTCSHARKLSVINWIENNLRFPQILLKTVQEPIRRFPASASCGFHPCIHSYWRNWCFSLWSQILNSVQCLALVLSCVVGRDRRNHFISLVPSLTLIWANINNWYAVDTKGGKRTNTVLTGDEEGESPNQKPVQSNKQTKTGWSPDQRGQSRDYTWEDWLEAHETRRQTGPDLNPGGKPGEQDRWN